MMKTTKILTVLALTASLAACGTSKSDRALSGAGIGAAAGGVGAAVLGANPVTGAVLGGAVGGVTGAATNKNDVNLGKPIWR